MRRSQTRRTVPPAQQQKRGSASSTFGAAFEAARETVGAGASELVEQVKENSREFLSERKGVVAGELTNVGRAIRRAADKLQDTDSAFLAGYVDTAAERVEEIGRYVEQHDLRDVIDDVSGLAQRKPLLFMGGMFVAGLAAARFLRSASGPEVRRSRRG